MDRLTKIFKISLIFEAFIIFYVIHNMVFGTQYLGETIYGIDALSESLSDVYYFVFFDKWIFAIIPAFQIFYGFYYLIEKLNGISAQKLEREITEEIKEIKDSSNKTKRNYKKVPFIMLIISFIPYTYLFLGSIFVYFTGYNTGWFSSNIEYGLDASWAFLFWMTIALSILGILPICIIYQIAYAIRKYKESKEKN